MVKITKNRASYELGDEITELRRLCRLCRDISGDTYSRLSDAADCASSGDEFSSLVGIFSGAVLEAGWRLEILIELLCSLDEKLAGLEALSEPASDDVGKPSAQLSPEQLESALLILTGKAQVSSKKLCALLRDLDAIREEGNA